MLSTRRHAHHKGTAEPRPDLLGIVRILRRQTSAVPRSCRARRATGWATGRSTGAAPPTRYRLLRQRQTAARPPAGWTVEPVPVANSQAARLHLRRTAPTGWADLVQTIESESARAGTRLVSLDITSNGSRQVRAIAAVEILLEHPTETPSRLNPSGGTVFPGADVPAMPPAVGPVPSLRRPSAAAGPAAPGSSSAPVRPDPRGPRAGTPSNPNPSKP